MKTATLTLYYKSLLNKDKNFILDEPVYGKPMVETYLATLQKETITGFQYVKHAVFLTIKINKNQQALNMGKNADDLNYIKIQNDGENPKFYFIVGKNWKAEETIELVLNMDTLNSFRFNSDYELNAKTLIKREHRDRFSEFSSQSFSIELTCPMGISYHFYTDLLLSSANLKSVSFSMGPHAIPKSNVSIYSSTNADGVRGVTIRVNNNTLLDPAIVPLRVTYEILAFNREIDLKSEEINCPVYKYDEMPLFEQEGRSAVNWALYYRNADNQENSPVDCYLLPDTAISAIYQTGNGQVNVNNVPANGDYIIFYAMDVNGYNIDVDGHNYIVKRTTGWAYGTYVRFQLLACRKYNGNLEVYQANMEGKELAFPAIPVFSGEWKKIFTGTYITVDTNYDKLAVRQVEDLPSASAWIVANQGIGTLFEINFGTMDSLILLSTADIDRTLAENIKIIDVPYCPSSYSLDGSGNIVLPSLWKLDTNKYMIQLRNLGAKFVNDITSGARNVLVNFINEIPSGDLTDMKRTLKDSKLYHSDYYRTKFVYDSFSKVFELEKMSNDLHPEDSIYFQFRFVMSRNIVSKFLFKFFYDYKVSLEDFNNIVAVARNNEEVLYNSSYLNYVRTGYNYDLKTKERQETSSAVGIGLSALGMVASVVLAVATENPLPIAGAVAGAIGLVGQTANYAKQTAQNEDNIQRKLQEAQQQAVSVLNADDIDLLTEYSGNKAKLCYYKASDRMMEILDDLFYYGGYITNEQKIPVVNSRYWFNFVQATLVLEETNNLTEEIENDIKSKFETGVTFLHYRHNRFDFKQEMENIEKKLI